MPESYGPIKETLDTVALLQGRKKDTAPVLSLGGSAAVPEENHSGAKTDQQILRLWLDSKRSENTKKAYAHDISLFNDFIARLPATHRPTALNEVTVQHIEEFHRQMCRMKTPARTAARRLSSVKSLLTFAQLTGYLHFNVGSVVKLPPFPQDLSDKFLSEAEVQACVYATKPGRDRTLVLFLYYTGCRVSEAVRVRWEHLSFREDRVVVQLFGKGGRTRYVPIPVQLRQQLEALKHANMSGFVFETRGGNPLNPKDAWRVVHNAAKRSGISGYPHKLRHSHASHAIRRGADIQVVQSTLGHASIRTTGEYLHIERGASSAMHLDPEPLETSE